MGDTVSLDSAVELRGEDTQFDTVTYVTSAIFNLVAFPPNMPDYLRRHIEAEAAFAQRLDDAGVTIGGANGGPIGEKTKAQRQKEKADEAFEIMTSQVEERREHERQEWARSQHSLAGTQMTGSEWGELASDLRRNGPLRDWLVQRLLREGGSKEEAKRKAAEFADAATIMGKPQSEWTPAEREKIDRANADPIFRKVLPELQEQRLNGPEALARRDISQANLETSTTARADLFASAPALTGQYQIAVAATKPLDVPKSGAAPLVLAPAPAGLDV